MKRQVVVIHGGDTFDTYEEYFEFLKRHVIEPDYFTAQDTWKKSLGEKLGEEWEVLAPQMPSKLNAKYAEWEIWFEKFFPFWRDELVLVGHSLGGIFLAKYLAEYVLPVKIAGIFLVAAPFNDADVEYSLADFRLPANLGKLENLAAQRLVHFYHSRDDDTVPFGDFEKYMQALPGAKFTEFSDRGHFRGPEFPELVTDILATFGPGK